MRTEQEIKEQLEFYKYKLSKVVNSESKLYWIHLINELKWVLQID